MRQKGKPSMFRRQTGNEPKPHELFLLSNQGGDCPLKPTPLHRKQVVTNQDISDVRDKKRK